MTENYRLFNFSINDFKPDLSWQKRLNHFNQEKLQKITP